MAARSDEPAKRCDRPQSLSASAAGRRRASISAKTSMAAERRAAGVMQNAPLANSCHFILRLHGGSALRAGRLMPAHVLAQFLYRLREIVHVNAFRRFAGFDARQHAPQQIVIVLVAIGLEIEILRHLRSAARRRCV